MAVALTIGGLAAAQSDPAVFKVEADTVRVEFSVFRILQIIRVRRPYTALTQEDVAVSIDKKPLSGATLIHDEKNPGHYLASGTVPFEYRDGAAHLVEVTLRGRGGRPMMVIPKTVTFPTAPATTP